MDRPSRTPNTDRNTPTFWLTGSHPVRSTRLWSQVCVEGAGLNAYVRNQLGGSSPIQPYRSTTRPTYTLDGTPADHVNGGDTRQARIMVHKYGWRSSTGLGQPSN